MTEAEQATVIANRVLDRINADPDDDLAVLSRRLLHLESALLTARREAGEAMRERCVKELKRRADYQRGLALHHRGNAASYPRRAGSLNDLAAQCDARADTLFEIAQSISALSPDPVTTETKSNTETSETSGGGK